MRAVKAKGGLSKYVGENLMFADTTVSRSFPYLAADSLHRREVSEPCKQQSNGTRNREFVARDRTRVKGGLAQAGLSGAICSQATGQTQVVSPRSVPTPGSTN